MNTPLEVVRKRIDERRGYAAVVLATGRFPKARTITDAERKEVNGIEQRCGVSVRRIQRLQRLHEREEGDIAYLDLPEKFSLDDVEHVLGILGAVSEDDPGAKEDGSGRRRPPPNFGERK